MNSQANQNKKASWKAIQKLLSSYRKGKPLQPVERTNNLHLSFEQERLWFLNQLGGDNTVYNFPFAFWSLRKYMRSNLTRNPLSLFSFVK